MDFLQNHVREEVRGMFPRSKTGQSLMNVGKGVIVLRSLLSSGIICAFSKTMCRISAILKPPSGHSDATFQNAATFQHLYYCLNPNPCYVSPTLLRWPPNISTSNRESQQCHQNQVQFLAHHALLALHSTLPVSLFSLWQECSSRISSIILLRPLLRHLQGPFLTATPT